ncbi:MAG: ABC transporter permease [Defluviitaleaceae bacterium]|nr:ABC transporter permease [Defluviitaleaceae bacterium]
MTMFLLRKMWKNRWLMLCLLVGNILLIGIASATPLYSQATMERILQQELTRYQRDNNRHPAILSLRLTHNQSHNPYGDFENARYVQVPQMAEHIGIPVLTTYEVHMLTNHQLHPADPRGIPRTGFMNLKGLDSLYENVHITAGRLPSETMIEIDGGFIIEAIATDATLATRNLLMDELLYMPISLDFSYYVQIVGIYEHREEAGLLWTTIGSGGNNTVLMSNNIIREWFLPNYSTAYRVVSRWYHLLDQSAISSRRVEHYLSALEDLELFNSTNVRRFGFNFTEGFIAHQEVIGPFNTILWVLQVPLYVLLAFYIYMVSRQILMQDQNEISIASSRGVSRRQLMMMYMLQGLIIILASFPVGLWLGMVLCRMLGASSGFLQLVQRAAITVEVTPTVLLYTGIALALSFFTMFVPVIGFSRVGIVEHKRRKRGLMQGKPLWQRFFLDILCLGIALYGLYSFNMQQEVIAQLVQENAAVDPLIFLASSLFIIGFGLFALRLFPYVVKLVYLLGRRFWAPQAYAALLRVVRSFGEEQFIMIFLVITLSMGIFSAHGARTINTNSDHHIMYMTGADLVFQETWRSNIPQLSGAFLAEMEWNPPERVIYNEPEFGRFTGLAEVEAITRVQHFNIDLTLRNRASRVDNMQLMAIESDTFGDTVWFRQDFLPIHINHFLNALAQTPNGVLLSYNFKSQMDYQVGDTVMVRYHYRPDLARLREYVFTAELTVVGFVELWPGYSPVGMGTLATGEVAQVSHHLAIANLGYLHTQWGLFPYQVWMRTNTDTNNFFLDVHQDNNLQLTRFYDSKGAIIESRSDPILQGINGVLTMGFVVTMIICFAGFLIYWLLSIRGRVLQFGVFRAMGMSMGRIVGLLINEQVLITLMAIAIGALVGEVTARLFVPLIQVSHTATEQVIPLVVVRYPRDYLHLYGVIGAMVLVCLIILGIYVKRINITQALKLGED